MGIVSYIILLIDNAELLTKILLILIIILFIYINLISIFIFLKLKNEKNILSNITYINNNNNTIRKIVLKKKSKTYYIYISAIKKFTSLYKNGITDLNIILNIIKKSMITEMLNENIYFYINKVKIIKKLLININILYVILTIIILFQEKNIMIYKKINTTHIMLALNEILFSIILTILTLFQIKIIENIFANLNLTIYNKQKLFIKNFLLILYNKFYE
ncbi:MAG TPA: hypothetical protein ACYCDB_00970 [Candidatus Azoamicus sp.]